MDSTSVEFCNPGTQLARPATTIIIRSTNIPIVLNIKSALLTSDKTCASDVNPMSFKEMSPEIISKTGRNVGTTPRL